MLCPEVWNFKTPVSDYKSKIHEFDETNCSEKINSFCYNHLVSVVLPDTLQAPEAITEILGDDCEYYKIGNLVPSELLNGDFIENFVKKGNLTALGVNATIDCEDCVCITPQTFLILSLTKETYQSLGLEGKTSQFCHNTKYKYIVKINLSLDILRPGTNYYKKVTAAFGKLLNVDLILNWEPPSEDVCPSSIAKYFHDLKYNVALCKPKCRTRTDYSVKVPVIDFEGGGLFDTLDIVEWLGMFSLQCDLETGRPDNFITTYQTVEPNKVYGQVKYLEWRGLFTVKQIQKLVSKLRNYALAEGRPWVSLYVQGFSDAPINWSNREQHYYTNGDNSYIILFNSQHYMFCTQSCSLKYYSK